MPEGGEQDDVPEETIVADDGGRRAGRGRAGRNRGLHGQGHITGPGGEPFGSSGAVINCPVVFRLL